MRILCCSVYINGQLRCVLRCQVQVIISETMIKKLSGQIFFFFMLKDCYELIQCTIRDIASVQ